MNFIRPRSPASIMTATLGEVIEAARNRAAAASARRATHEAIDEQWRHADASLDALIIGDPSASEDNVLEAFRKVAAR